MLIKYIAASAALLVSTVLLMIVIAGNASAGELVIELGGNDTDKARQELRVYPVNDDGTTSTTPIKNADGTDLIIRMDEPGSAVTPGGRVTQSPADAARNRVRIDLPEGNYNVRVTDRQDNSTYETGSVIVRGGDNPPGTKIKIDGSSKIVQVKPQDRATTGDTQTSMYDSRKGPELSIRYDVGEIDLGKAYSLRTELGGMISWSSVIDYDMEDTYQSVSGGLSVPLDIGLGKGFGLSFAGQYGWADGSSTTPEINVGGDQTCILGPEGQAGPLSGGACTAAGFGDVTDARVSFDYDETLINLDAYWDVEWENNIANFTNAGTPTKPEVRLSAGVFYGYTDLDVRQSGFTNADTLYFEYNDDVTANRFGVQLGVSGRVPVARVGNDGAFGLYADGKVRLVENWADGQSTLRFEGAMLPSENQSDSKSFFDVGAVIGGGFYYDAGPVIVEIGGSYETWSVPTMFIPNPGDPTPEPASIQETDRDSWTVGLSVRYQF